MSKRVAAVSAVLVAALLAAVLGATAALGMIGSGTFGPGGRALSEADVRRSYAALPKPSATAPTTGTTSASPHPSGGPGTKATTRSDVFQSAGGTVFASCTAGRATVTSWIPATGYVTDGASQGPAASAWVKFKSASSELTVTVTCQGGKPRFSHAADNRGGGGGDDGGGSGRSRGGSGGGGGGSGGGGGGNNGGSGR